MRDGEHVAGLISRRDRRLRPSLEPIKQANDRSSTTPLSDLTDHGDGMTTDLSTERREDPTRGRGQFRGGLDLIVEGWGTLKALACCRGDMC